MVHMFSYIKGAKYLTLVMSADKIGIIKWYIFGSYDVHPIMRGHTEGGLTMGRGLPISVSSNQRLNTRSSTESKIVLVDQLIPLVL